MTELSRPSPDTRTQISSAISMAKDFFALFRDIGFAALAVLLILFPVTFNDRLTKAGFEEGSFAGLKWKVKLVESDAGLKEARIQLNDLVTQLTTANNLLKRASLEIRDPKLGTDISNFTSTTQSVNTAAEKVEANVSTIISTNAPLVERVQASGNGQWGVIYGGDTSLEMAKYEVESIARKYGIPNASIFQDRNGSYRSVSLVDSPADANQVLQKAKQRRRDAYVVRMATWCPNQIQKDGYQTCVGNP